MRRRSLLTACLLFSVLVLPLSHAFSQVAITVLPGDRVYPRYRADALDHQLSLTRVTENREWIGVIGGFVPVVGLGTRDVRVQWGIGASVFNRIIKTPGHITVATIDYRVDVPVDLALGGYVFRIGYGHISNHYADDGLEILGIRSINAVKDYLAAGIARTLPWNEATAYLHVTWNYHNEPLRDKKWMGQAGGSIVLAELAPWARVYGALDLKCKEEVNGGTTRSLQLGCELFRSEGRALRVAYTFRDGFEERGQLYAVSTTSNLVSLFIDM
jgi:hypothetical protein